MIIMLTKKMINIPIITSTESTRNMPRLLELYVLLCQRAFLSSSESLILGLLKGDDFSRWTAMGMTMSRSKQEYRMSRTTAFPFWVYAIILKIP